jgi:hypothetical protein
MTTATETLQPLAVADAQQPEDLPALFDRAARAILGRLIQLVADKATPASEVIAASREIRELEQLHQRAARIRRRDP